jgi:hypothetical protein
MPAFLPLVLRGIAVLLLGLLLQGPGWTAADGLHAAGPSGLREMHASLGPFLANSPFKGPLHLDSKESPRTLQGDVYAVVNYPFASVSVALSDAGNWCDVLILHLNVKHCRRNNEDAGTQVALRIGRKQDQPLASATLVAFSYRAVAATPEYMHVELEAPEGPFDTRNYRILLEAVPIERGRTFIHMGYSFTYGGAGRFAMQLYLSTIGRDKVGFTAARPTQPGEATEYIGGLRGLVERNTMRYYLAIDAYLAALSAPAAEQFEERIKGWFAATEKYPRQLHELDREVYLTMKRGEYKRQQSAS